jgi:magnesium-transporting ATPase (P-type)
MGRRGTDVAKEAADMVLTDDNFASIVEAIRQGRTTYANIGKFVSYILASNVPELVPFLVAVLFGVPLPLTLMQILAVDLGTDLIPALALGAEPPEPGIMNRPPRPRNARLLTGSRLLRAYGFLGVVQAALALFGFFASYWLSGWRPGDPMVGEGEIYLRATTMTLAGIVAAQIGNAFACRTDRETIFKVGFFSNRLLLQGIAVEIGILLALMWIPPLQEVFALAPLRASEWMLLAAYPLVMLGAEELRKAFMRRRDASRRAPVGVRSPQRA